MLPVQHCARHNLVDRANALIEKHCLPVPRFISSRFINYQFWSMVFEKIFGVKCDIKLRTASDQTEMITSCLNALESMIDLPLDHIKPSELLNFNVETIRNLLEIAEVYGNNITSDSTNEGCNKTSPNNTIEEENESFYEENYKPICARSKSEPNIYEQIHFDNFDSHGYDVAPKSKDLANLLYKALKNQILAVEIEKKIKLYLGDVTASKCCTKLPPSKNIRASRQSIVRTRAIQPLSTFNFDTSFSRRKPLNRVLSVELERWFPELSPTLIGQIRAHEQSMLLLEQNVIMGQQDLHAKRVNRMLASAVDRQRQRVELEFNQQRSNRQKFTKRQLPTNSSNNFSGSSVREFRTQRALVHKAVNQFYKEATAAYLNARSHLERILVNEFRKVETHQRDHINEIRKYLREHNQTEMDKVKHLLDSIDQLFKN